MTRILNFHNRRRALEAQNRFVVEPVTHWRVFDRVGGHEVFHVASEETARKFARQLQSTHATDQDCSQGS